MLAWLLALPRSVKRIISVGIDTFFLVLSLALAYLLTQGQETQQLQPIVLAFVIALPLTLFIFTKLGLYRAVIRYVGQHALGAVLFGIVLSAIVLASLFAVMGVHDRTNLVIVYALVALVTSGGFV
ncbi:hypothetical protein [Alishewanella sp. HL-SH05]|uniref:hypothetical protein n=1 Tax=Alishewanella sp. HL-SH05 TaxID=3461145 RepID=UPI004041B628